MAFMPRDLECLDGAQFIDKDGKPLLSIHRPNRSPEERPVFLSVNEVGDVLVGTYDSIPRRAV